MDDLDNIVQSQAKLVMEMYSNFEEIKQLASSMKDADGWGEYASEEEIESPDLELTEDESVEEDDGEADEKEVSYSGIMASGYKDSINQWKSYMTKHAEGEWFENTMEEFPPSLCLDPDEIDADDPEYAIGKPTGIPKSVWIHNRNANTRIPSSKE